MYLPPSTTTSKTAVDLLRRSTTLLCRSTPNSGNTAPNHVCKSSLVASILLRRTLVIFKYSNTTAKLLIIPTDTVSASNTCSPVPTDSKKKLSVTTKEHATALCISRVNQRQPTQNAVACPISTWRQSRSGTSPSKTPWTTGTPLKASRGSLSSSRASTISIEG